ncbi:MAG: DNA mismatch repair protein MutS [Acidobacteria bacterium]|nr:MAG: DNA mismatch repair protein MutS [Acidobacteriota bacterium]
MDSAGKMARHAVQSNTWFPQMLQDPKSEYGARLNDLGALKTGIDRRHKLLGRANLAIALAGLAVIVLALGTRSVSILWALAPAAALAITMAIHARTLRASQRYMRAIAFYERALARLDNRWQGAGETGERFLDPAHPYSRDLDLFGRGSMFELLSTARTAAGEEALARWLLAPAPVDEIHARHAAVVDLRERLRLREDLAVLGEDVRSKVHPDVLAAWAEADRVLKPGLARLAALVLAAAWLASLVAWFGWGWWQLALASSALNLFFNSRFSERVQKIVPDLGILLDPGVQRPPSTEDVTKDLAVLARVLERLEREQFSAPKLVKLQSALQVEGLCPSRVIARLGHLVEYMESRRNPVVGVINPFVFWSLQIAYSIEAWRAKFGPSIRSWLEVVGEMEALCALAGYTYEHPADTFPEFAEPEHGLFEAEGFAHPLLLETTAVRNDLALGGNLRLMIISGPNMAGKSTLIRAVGINAVLAQCGAPVRAKRLRMPPLAVAASICVLDSLQGGISRFYAEITRLKLITELTKGPLPVLFLLDELLSGTNSHDRRIGAEGLVRSLMDGGGIGLVTTHDLALAKMVDQLGPQAANFHFEDHLENGSLRFDYKLTPGIVQTSNALKLMRSIGLKV